ncbi:MAG TPA: universal stress protein [Solirubrobacterales bacterium]|jgi:nucleotide-binding universal stress UspA family protein|nr:universal stress protein [Solirubrobacterales bacterium]
MSEIIVGYDGSECSKAALEKACEMAKALGDKVVIVFGYAPGGYGGGEIPTHREAVEELAEKVTAEADTRAAEAGVEHEVKLKPLKPLHALVEAAGEGKARMIVVGSHSEAPLKSAIIGATPYKLLHHSEVPVLVVPASR